MRGGAACVAFCIGCLSHDGFAMIETKENTISKGRTVMNFRLICMLGAIAVAAGCVKNDGAETTAEPKQDAAAVAETTQPAAEASAAVVAEPAAEPAVEPRKPAKQPLKPIETPAAEPAVDPDSADGVIAASNALRDQGEFGEASRLLTTSLEKFKGADGERIAGAINDLRQVRREANELEYAVKMLSSGSYAELRVATSELSKSGDVGRILLRKIVRADTNELAVAQAVKLLARSASANEAAEIVGRLMANQDSSLRPEFIKALSAAPKSTPAETYAAMMPIVKNDADFENADFASLLIGSAFDACGGDGAAFDSAVGSDGAFEFLKEYARNALESTNDFARSFMSRKAAELGVMVKGIRGSFYADQNFENLVYERIEQQIQYPDRVFPYPDNRQDDISIRWTAKLVIKEKGSYHFHFTSDDGNRLYLDGEKIFGHWGNPADNRANVELDEGIHDIVIEFQQGQGGAYIRCNWIKPGGQEEPLTAEDTMCVPVY